MIQLSFIKLIFPIILILGSWTQVTPGLYILSPTEGQVVSGTVAIKGSLPDEDFSFAEISYTFEEGQNVNWFLIRRVDQPVHDDLLTLWDTTIITDGIYRIRLSVHQKNGEVHEVILENIKVGNYTHYEVTQSSMPYSETQSSEEELILTPTVPQKPAPTDFPKNSASIDREDIGFSLIAGLVMTTVIMGILGVYVYFRQASRNK